MGLFSLNEFVEYCSTGGLKPENYIVKVSYLIRQNNGVIIEGYVTENKVLLFKDGLYEWLEDWREGTTDIAINEWIPLSKVRTSTAVTWRGCKGCKYYDIDKVWNGPCIGCARTHNDYYDKGDLTK